jgi:hypothetical protein
MKLSVDQTEAMKIREKPVSVQHNRAYGFLHSRPGSRLALHDHVVLIPPVKLTQNVLPKFIEEVGGKSPAKSDDRSCHRGAGGTFARGTPRIRNEVAPTIPV